MARPIITTDNVGCRDVVKDNYNGFICKIKEVDDLVLKIKKFIALSRKEQELMGLNGRKVVLTNFNEDHIIKIYLDYLNKYFGRNLDAAIKDKRIYS